MTIWAFRTQLKHPEFPEAEKEHSEFSESVKKTPSKFFILINLV